MCEIYNYCAFQSLIWLRSSHIVQFILLSNRICLLPLIHFLVIVHSLYFFLCSWYVYVYIESMPKLCSMLIKSKKKKQKKNTFSQTKNKNDPENCFVFFQQRFSSIVYVYNVIDFKRKKKFPRAEKTIMQKEL